VGLLFLATTLHEDTVYITIAAGQVILATGMGLAVSPATNSVMASVPIRKAGIGSAMNDTTRQLGGALGVAVLGTIMNNAYLQGISTLRTDLPLLPDAAYEAIASSIQAAHIVANNPAVPAAAHDIIVNTANHAFIAGMNEGMFIGALIMFGASLFALVFLPAYAKRMDDEEIPAEAAGIPASAVPSGD
jgi:hypothetical protein